MRIPPHCGFPLLDANPTMKAPVHAENTEQIVGETRCLHGVIGCLACHPRPTASAESNSKRTFAASIAVIPL